jgi:transcriptional regulator with XRE-family HTH domain
MKGIGEKIRKIRNIRGYSQEYMGSRLSMSQNNYSRIELDQINLTLKTLSDIAGVLEIGTQELLNFNEAVLFGTIRTDEGSQPKNTYVQGSLVSLLQEEIISLREDKKRLLTLLERNQVRT